MNNYSASIPPWRVELTQQRERIAELEKTCKSRSDTIIEYSNRISELEAVAGRKSRPNSRGM